MLSKKLQNQDNSPFATGRTFLKILGVSVPDDTLKKSLENHPDFPSLFSLKDVLLSYGVKSAAVQIEGFNLSDFQTPFICAIKKNEWESTGFTLIKSIDNEIVTFYNTVKLNWEDVALNIFKEWHTGIVLLAEKSESSNDKIKGRKGVYEIIQKELVKKSWLLFLAPILFTLFYSLEHSNSSLSWYGTTSLILNTCGLALSVLLLWHEIDSHNPFLKRLCSNGQKNDCGSVLESKGAKVFGISWSAIGFSYFLTNTLSHIFFGLSQGHYLIIWASTSIIISPFIAYSLIYQWRVVRQWCVFCLGVQGILLTLLISGICYIKMVNDPFKNINYYTVFVQATFFTLLIIATVSFLSIIKKAKESEQYRSKWQRLKSNPEIFKALLERQQKVTVSTDGVGVVIGNQNALHEIIMVSNPYCAPCSIAHKEICDILSKNDNMRLRIIFSLSLDEKDFRSPPVRHILAIDILGDKEITKKAIDDWYSVVYEDLNAFKKAYPLRTDHVMLEERIKTMYNWCNMMNVRQTPTIYFDGFLLPDNYAISELVNFV
ncbi:vitamin K epoxide reductase family protein [Pedobacter suwonensis]|uniref:vitamin K epoxide reductase family protein n=1 Tax=Pedobacter suwonensis TaxID=332999 RepID=UPI0011A96BD4|nr:vitamin K epoxide reductase family protein [Pedobacter suwonensis]